MSDETMYRLEGKFSLTDKNKMKEMNELILEILRKTGTCRLTKKTVYGNKLQVVEVAKPNSNGVIKFNYSIFEKKERQINYYDTKTGELVTPDRGFNHFGLTMNMIMMVLEAYSETPYYLMYGDKLSNVSYTALIVEELTGKVLEFNWRARPFDTMAYFRQNNRYKNFEYSIYDYPYDYCRKLNDQFIFAFFILDEPITKPEKENESKLNKDRYMAYLCMELLKNNKDLKEDALEYISKLMDMTLTEREIESKKKHTLDFISRVSIHLPAAYLVKIYAAAFEMDFFTLWEKIGKEGYWDVIGIEPGKEKIREVKTNHILYEIYKKNNEDDFIGVWDKNDIIFSDTMIENMSLYKQLYLTIEEQLLEDYDSVTDLLACVDDLQDIWNKDRYLYKDMLEEFVKFKDDMRYKKAVYVLRMMINDEIELFSEMTEQQIREWILHSVNWKRYADRYWHYIDLLNNKKRRSELLGF